jgi:hypothetical protein
MTEGMWALWQGFCHGTAEGGLSVRDPPDDGPPQRPFPLTPQVCPVLLSGRQQAAGQEHLCSQTIAQAPQALGANVWLPSSKRQDPPAMRLGNPLEPERGSHRAGHECVRALQERQDRAGRNGETAPRQLLLALGHPAGLGMAQGANPGDAIAAKLVLGQRQPSFCLGPIRGPKRRTDGGDAVPDVAGEAPHIG